jgi:hypothetical protein
MRISVAANIVLGYDLHCLGARRASIEKATHSLTLLSFGVAFFCQRASHLGVSGRQNVVTAAIFVSGFLKIKHLL